MILFYLLGKTPNGVRALNVEDRTLHTRIGLHGFLQQIFAAAGNDDLIAFRAKRLGQASANSRSSAGNQNRVPADLHDVFSFYGAKAGQNNGVATRMRQKDQW